MTQHHGFLPAKLKRKEIDMFAYFAILVGVIFTVPQLYEIIINQSSGSVSLFTWVAYTVMSFFWLIYGIERKLKPVIISSAIYIILDFFIVASIIKFN